MEHMKTSKTMLSAIAIVLTILSAPAFADAMQDAAAAYARGDYAAELKITKPLAEKGESWAQQWLGLSYALGTGVPQDYAEAVKWYRLAATQGDADAQLNLGVIYNHGRGVVQDYAEAVKWYRLAAAQGNAPAQSNLGLLYDNGRGVVQDYVRAHMWYNLGAVSGKAPKAAKNRDELAAKMTPAQIAEAQKLARECQARSFKGC